ncbi:hypothetical protein ABGB18_44755 [Nonomuraea sp. B12E4]|uniref:hypothetical protein n=1 Tax=Nonomuraea sp. B12E4 TaxID=3153564 RepID=UPI00325DA639
MEGNQLISRRSDATSDLGVRGRLRVLAIATAVACGTVVSGGSAAMASATNATEAALAGYKANVAEPTVKKPRKPWLDSVGITLTDDTAPTVFRVSANGGVPWVYDPRNAAGSRWQSLRQVPGSQGGFVTNITVAQGDPAASPVVGATFALAITARTGAGIYQTTCAVEDAGGDVTFTPVGGVLTNCSAWALLPA